MAQFTVYSNKIERPGRDMVAVGAVKDWRAIHRAGQNVDVGTAIEDVWLTGGIYSYPTSPSILEILSTSALDTYPGGTGARTVFLEGLNSDWMYHSEVVQLNGTTPVETAEQFIRFNRAHVLTTGTYGQATAGDITIQIQGGGAVQGLIPHTVDGDAWDLGATQIARYSIPADRAGYITQFTINAESNKPADIAICFRRNADVTAGDMTSPRVIEQYTGVAGYIVLPIVPFTFLPKTDVFFRTKLSAGSAGHITVSYDMFLGELGSV